MTLVDAATAGLMAGAGAKAARAATQLAAIKAAARVPAQEAIAAGLLKEHARKEMVRGFARTAGSAFVSGTARTAMQDGTWDEGVLSGLGRSVKGGAHAAAVGLATHGASHAFSQSGLGQKLGQSTSYFKRGLGSGLGGALGGMAGSGAELSLDALGGHAQGSWYDALGSIALAGGRGFAENFGHGIAEVPKARRDAAQEHFNEMRKMSDNERVARFGMTEADAVSDQRFARMAAAAAMKNDPKTNVKAFLADLNTAVAQDRAVVENNRQLVRQFRREALASIPEDRRGEFADVPIHVLPDAQFEKFTGSQSGRAVTIIVDGEAQIVVRKSATPETLREEGIHVLQSRDPKWREKIARLDEKTMSRWHELDLETQLSLYRDKIEVEIDAHQRLRRDLIADAEREPDPARRKALLERTEKADVTLKNLQARQAEVEAIGPERIDAIKRGDEGRPQYLREPSRLFAKETPLPASALGASELKPKRSTVKRNTPLEHSDDLSQEKRYEVDIRNSTWGTDYPDHTIRQVGGAWPESESLAGGGKRQRWYRMVELVDPEGTVIDRRREILQIEGSKRWQQRGSETSERGSLFEEASRQRTLARARVEIIEQRERAGTRKALGDEFRPNQDELVPIGALHARGDRTRQPLNAQHGGGAGFDDVKIRFRRVGRELVAEIIIIEAKRYARSLSLEDFSAITANMDANLAHLDKVIAMSNLSPARREAAARAIAARNVSLELHLSPSSGLGRMKASGATIVRDIKNTEMARRQLAAVQESFANVDRRSLSGAERRQLDVDVAHLKNLAKNLNDAYAAESLDVATVQKALAAILDRSSESSTIGMARRYGFELNEAAVIIQRQKIDLEGADKQFARQAAAARLKASPRAQSAFTIAQNANLADKSFRPAPIAHTAPADVTLAVSRDRTRSLAITRPSVGAPGSDGDGVSAASRQLVALLRDGVPQPGGRVVHPDNLLWDASSASPVQIEQVLRQVRTALASDNGDPRRLRVLVEGAVATDEATLRNTLALPDSVGIASVTRTPDGSRTWVLSFTPQWLDGPRRRR
jgi:hypothetical protein